MTGRELREHPAPPLDHRTIDSKILYFGTPVVLLSTFNEDGTSNLAPVSSAWAACSCWGWAPPGRRRATSPRTPSWWSTCPATCPWSGGDRALLAAMIDDEGGRIRRLLDRLGVDTDRVRRDLDGPAEAQGAPAPRTADGGPTGDREAPAEGWDHATYEAEVPVPAARLWDLVGDPARRAEWDPGADSSRLLDGGVVELTRQDGTTRERIVRSVAGREVTWEQGGPGARHTIRITIEPVGDHARLRLRKDWPTGLKGRIANNVLRWFMRSTLRYQAQTITQAAAA
jgi:hypothetical protein